MIVVSNASPLTNLAAIGQFDLLCRLYAGLHIPAGVWDELNAGDRRWPGCDEVAEADWIESHIVQNQALVTALRRDLDRGEAESIALAVELGADLVLMDEREGRHAAQRSMRDNECRPCRGPPRRAELLRSQAVRESTPASSPAR